MSVTSGFYNSVGGDRKYNATQMSRLFQGIINDGVFASIGDSLHVTAGSGMTVNVGTGRAWFNNTWTDNDAVLPLAISPAEAVLNRIDAVVLEVGSDSNVRQNTIKIIKGTPASSPTKPELIKVPGQYQYPLAYVYVEAGVTSIDQNKITNMVNTPDCPFVTVVGLDALLPEWQEQFDVWFADLQNQLSGNVATNLQNQINALGQELDEEENARSTHEGKTAAHGATGAVVGTTNTQTLTNKTLTSPKVNQILDAVNGLVALVISGVANAVNYLTLKNSIAGVSPSIEATGADANIDINLTPKGTGKVKLSGVEAGSIGASGNAVNAVAVGSSADPNTTTESYILTNHANSPNTSYYWHIQTYFYSTKTGNRAQIAVSYNTSGTDEMYIRHYYSSAWTAWRRVLHSNNFSEFVTAADVLAKIKTVDGDGSDLDADRIKGRDTWWRYDSYYAVYSNSGLPTLLTTANQGAQYDGTNTFIQSYNSVYKISDAGVILGQDLNRPNTYYQSMLLVGGAPKCLTIQNQTCYINTFTVNAVFSNQSASFNIGGLFYVCCTDGTYFYVYRRVGSASPYTYRWDKYNNAGTLIGAHTSDTSTNDFYNWGYVWDPTESKFYLTSGSAFKITNISFTILEQSDAPAKGGYTPNLGAGIVRGSSIYFQSNTDNYANWFKFTSRKDYTCMGVDLIRTA